MLCKSPTICFRYNLEVVDEPYGIDTGNGHWNGVVGILQRRVRFTMNLKVVLIQQKHNELYDVCIKDTRVALTMASRKLVAAPNARVPHLWGLFATSVCVFKEADLGIGPISITAERAAVVDFTYTFMETGAAIMMRTPKEILLFRVFSPFSWYSIPLPYY